MLSPDLCNIFTDHVLGDLNESPIILKKQVSELHLAEGTK